MNSKHLTHTSQFVTLSVTDMVSYRYCPTGRLLWLQKKDRQTIPTTFWNVTRYK